MSKPKPRAVLKALADSLFATEEKRIAEVVKKNRKKEVALERASRRQRAAKTPRAYSTSAIQNEQKTLAAIASAESGILPQPTSVRVFADGTYETIWAFPGPHGLGAVDAILIHCKDSFPPEAKGNVAQGTGYRKSSVWIGTRFAKVHG